MKQKPTLWARVNYVTQMIKINNNDNSTLKILEIFLHINMSLIFLKVKKSKNMFSSIQLMNIKFLFFIVFFRRIVFPLSKKRIFETKPKNNNMVHFNVLRH